jgi:hypothetical protein
MAFSGCSNLLEIYYTSPYVPVVHEKIYDQLPNSFVSKYKDMDLCHEWKSTKVLGNRSTAAYSVIEEVPNDKVNTNEYTLVIRDTITQYEPIYKEIHKVEKVLVPVVDTMRVTDTLYVYLEREQVVWQDSLSRVYASGILPQIDSVQHYITERIVTKEVTIHVKKPCKWGIGVQGGYGMGLSNGKVIGSPYIGIGIYYNLISW